MSGFCATRTPRWSCRLLTPALARAGGASCVLVNDIFWLAYRIRRPLDSGRGVGVVVAHSTDGVSFKPVCEVGREAFGAASLERPVILPTDFGWRLYLSCAT